MAYTNEEQVMVNQESVSTLSDDELLAVRDAHLRTQVRIRLWFIVAAFVMGVCLIAYVESLPIPFLGFAPLVFTVVALTMLVLYFKAQYRRMGAVTELERRGVEVSGSVPVSGSLGQAYATQIANDRLDEKAGRRLRIPVAGLAVSLVTEVVCVTLIITEVVPLTESVMILALIAIPMIAVFGGWALIAIIKPGPRSNGA